MNLHYFCSNDYIVVVVVVDFGVYLCSTIGNYYEKWIDVYYDNLLLKYLTYNA